MADNCAAHLEASWKKEYILKKDFMGVNLTRFLDENEIKEALAKLESHTDDKDIELWLEHSLTDKSKNSLTNSIRAKRYRYNNAATAVKKKQIDLHMYAWRMLAEISKAKNITHSETIVLLYNNYRECCGASLTEKLTKDELCAIAIQVGSIPDLTNIAQGS
ncbi:hypothetical protein A1QO_00715 [Vibrio genomosp. F10 str. ZF-129]|uniref:Macrodomain Ter protein n=1 Tax=Vibrio genomosp. F10 str. ZF-129 TaxID=1187848 RepID=A0A1E5BGB5_9VIBR|nr:hypothetical protein [Vibrio genomosp. F10]OEE35314.1 hypothetical protein A1QO_00715 [Vibrio genomosp. F10 str. ZF-129]